MLFVGSSHVSPFPCYFEPWNGSINMATLANRVFCQRSSSNPRELDCSTRKLVQDFRPLDAVSVSGGRSVNVTNFG